MALAEQQDIPKRPVEKEPWTVRRLFPFGGTAKSLIKTFTSPLDILLGFLILVIGSGELLERTVSWMFWMFTILILAATMYERYEKKGVIEPESKEEKK